MEQDEEVLEFLDNGFHGEEDAQGVDGTMRMGEGWHYED